MRQRMEKLGLTADLMVTIIFGLMVLGGVIIGGTALYLAPIPPDEAVPPVFAGPEAYAGRSGTYVEGVIRRVIEPGMIEVAPLRRGMAQPDPPLLVVLGPGAQQARLRAQAQQVFFWGTVIRSPEDVPPGVTLTPQAQRLLEEGQLFFYAEWM
jgi:hypothetical protein